MKKLFLFLFFVMSFNASYGALQFRLSKVMITGVPPGPLPKLVYDTIAEYQNQIINLPVLTVIRNRIQASYRAEGYFLSRALLVPSNLNPKDATVQFKISGGRIGKFDIKGDFPGTAFWQLKRYLLEIKEDYPLNVHHVQKYLLLVNELPGISGRAIMFPSKSGKSPDMLLTLTTKKASAFVGSDNRQSTLLGDVNISTGGSIYRVLGADSLTLTAITDPSFDKNLGANVAYDTTFGAFGAHFVITYSYTQTHPTDAKTNTQLVKGLGDTLDFQFNIPILYTQNRIRFVSGFTHLSSNSVLTYKTATQYQDYVSKLYVGITFKAVQLWQYSFLRYGWIQGGVRMEQGLPLWGAEAEPAHPSTPKGTSVFSKFVGHITTRQYLTNQWSVEFGIKTQISNSDLLASEKLGYGGADYGQSFTPFAYTGDAGFLTKLSTGYDYTFGINRARFLVIPFVYFDGGFVSNVYRNIVTGQTSTFFAMGTGGGLKFSTLGLPFGTFSTAVQYGVPLGKGITTDKNLYFSVMYQY